MRQIPRIGINALALTPQGSGVQTYIRELLGALKLLTPAELHVAVQARAVGVLPSGVKPASRPAADGARRVLHGLRPLRGVDLVHGLDVDVPFQPRTPIVATIHDLSVFDVPWAHPRRRRIGEQLLIRRTLARADALVVPSRFVAERVQALFGREAVPTPLGACPDMAPPRPEAMAAVRRRYGLPERFVLQVGTLEPRKDAARLARACRTLGAPLVLAGGRGYRGHVPAGARWLGYVPRADLSALYGAATLVAYISRYEGFGLPPLEAMACGAPVVATRVGGLPEAVRDGAELVGSRSGEGALERALSQLLDDHARRNELATRGLQIATELSWMDTAHTTVAVYRQLGLPI